MQVKIKELTESGNYSEAFSYFQSLRRNIGYKPAPYVTVNYFLILIVKQKYNISNSFIA
jgi:hypothetical protein